MLTKRSSWFYSHFTSKVRICKCATSVCSPLIVLSSVIHRPLLDNRSHVCSDHRARWSRATDLVQKNMSARRSEKCESGTNSSGGCGQKGEVDSRRVRGHRLLSDTESLLAFKGHDQPHGAPTTLPPPSFSRCIDTALIAGTSASAAPPH